MKDLPKSPPSLTQSACGIAGRGEPYRLETLLTFSPLLRSVWEWKEAMIL
ncbi:hypothetical protein V2U94_00960 [Paenibacillus polymyxa]|nr:MULTISPECIES: hypothetical protein [Paenibacillus]MEE4566192.1 hypothetical protein [Paenibacillus polymyxa]